MTFQDDLNRMMAEATADMGRRFLADHPDLTVTYDTTPLTVHKHASYVPMSLEQLLDAGLITEAQARAQGWVPYVPPPVPWSRRLRWRWQAWRERTGRKVGGWLAGVDLSERDED